MHGFTCAVNTDWRLNRFLSPRTRKIGTNASDTPVSSVWPNDHKKQLAEHELKLRHFRATEILSSIGRLSQNVLPRVSQHARSAR